MKKLKSIFRPEAKYLPFFIAILMIGLGCGLYKGIIDNYLAEIVGMGEFDRGVMEFFRELPGLALVFILAALYMLSAEAIYKIGAAVMLAGMFLIGVVPPSKVMITFAICIFSLGEHLQLGMKSTISLQYAKPGKGGQALGLQNSMNEIGMLIGYVVIIFAFIGLSGETAYRIFFLIAAGMILVGTVMSFAMKGKTETDKSKRRFYFHRKYTKYYFLEVFYGARKQVFLTFGPYVLILFYKADASTISMLFAISAICCFLAAPLIGKIIDKLGYKIVMVADTLILVIVCFFYGFSHRLFPMETAFIVVCVNYMLDAIISLASMASSVYVQDLSDNDEEVRATLSTGISVNHLVTILIALFGGWIWQTLGMETLFMLSAVLGLCNSAYAASIKRKDGGRIKAAKREWKLLKKKKNKTDQI